MMWLILVPVAIALFIFLARRGGGGSLGRKIRVSDYLALEDAIMEAQEQIAVWKDCKTVAKSIWRKQEFQDDIDDFEIRLTQLIALRPKYAVDKN